MVVRLMKQRGGKTLTNAEPSSWGVGNGDEPDRRDWHMMVKGLKPGEEYAVEFNDEELLHLIEYAGGYMFHRVVEVALAGFRENARG